MILETSHIDSTLVIVLPQRFDSANAMDIEAEMKEITAGNPGEVLLDLSRMDYIASAGIRVLLVITRAVIKSGGKIAFASLHPRVQQIFAMGGFTKVFPIYATKEGALSSFR
ncbi:MAG: STAS domain-containing protein [Methanoregulaceae archaeon]